MEVPRAPGLYWIITKAEEIRTVVAVMEDGTVYRLGDEHPVPFNRIAWWSPTPLDVPESPGMEPAHDAHAALGAAAQDLLPYIGEIADGEFVPCPQASLSATERAEITPWVYARWASLLAAVEHLYGPQECGRDCCPNVKGRAP